MGNDFSKGVDSAVSIITGIITGDVAGGLAGASAPWLAEQIKLHTGHLDKDGEWVTDNLAGNLISHAILGAVVAELQGHSGLAGGAGAVAGELASKAIIGILYGDKKISELSEDEKQTVSALSQLATGLAATSIGSNFGDASAAIRSSKNAVENNFLGHQDQSRLVQLRKKRDESFLTQAEKIEMFMLDELDQKGDYLVGKYYKDPNSLTDAEAQQLRYSLTRYYQQVEGMSGKEAAKQSMIHYKEAMH